MNSESVADLRWNTQSFNAPIYATIFDDEDGDGSTLIWSRARGLNGD